MSHLLDCSGLLASGGRASPLGRPHPVSYPVSYLSKYRDLEIWVGGRSRSLKMASCDRPRTSSYLSFIVTMAVSFTVFIARSILTRDIDIANMSVRLSVRYVPVMYDKKLIRD